MNIILTLKLINMEALRNKVRSFMDSPEEIVNELDANELNYIVDLMNELNRSGKQHSISKIKRSEKVLDIETNYKISFIKK
jgi:hypothetical protein